MKLDHWAQPYEVVAGETVSNYPASRDFSYRHEERDEISASRVVNNSSHVSVLNPVHRSNTVERGGRGWGGWWVFIVVVSVEYNVLDPVVQRCVSANQA